ncbi:MFS transporter [Nocardiopsis halophila]|uniref:MFS transporter n=1 Tax=Nocardiopsis halophila TaxID=141692 RepID=UPI00034C0AED|nr:MFS transporter [Nocardiopsis halophila]
MKAATTSASKWKATTAVAMSNYIEAGSIIAIATSLSLWQDEFGLDSMAVGLLSALSANAFGAAIGAAVGGPLCDRYGRKFIYTYDLLLYMLGTLFAVFAMNFGMLLTGFVLTGIAVGAGVTAAWTYIAEEAPDDRRAGHVGVAQLAWSIGPAIGFLLAVLVEPLGLLGARLVFAHLFVVAAVTWWVRRGLDESQRWKEQRSDPERVGTYRGFLQLLTHRKNLTALLFLVGVYGLWNTVAGQAGIFQPRIYEATGLTDASSQYLLQVLVWTLTSAATFWGFMKHGDSFSRRRLYFIGAALGVAAWAVLIYGPAGWFSLLFFATGWGVSAGIGAQAFYGLWAAELFATRYRASAQGVMFMLVRVMVGVLSLWFPLMLEQTGIHGVGVLILGLLVAALVIGTVWAPKTQGKSLEQIEVERYGRVLDPGPRGRTPAAAGE